jgi:replicative DNA helicase
VVDAAGILERGSIYIDDSSLLNALEVRAKSRRLKAEKKDLSLIIIDYLQLMKGSQDAENQEQEISGISRSLKSLAKELNVPVIALSQLSRAIEKRTGKDNSPMLSDLRGSGAIEQDADLILFLQHENCLCLAMEPCTCGKRNAVQVNIGKNRNGPTGQVNLVFLRHLTRFENKAPVSLSEPGYAH